MSTTQRRRWFDDGTHGKERFQEALWVRMEQSQEQRARSGLQSSAGQPVSKFGQTAPTHLLSRIDQAAGTGHSIVGHKK